MALVRALLIVTVCVYASAGSLESALGDSASCHGVCEGTYPLHTYPEEEELFACHRGCRLFTICQFVEDGVDLNKTRTECESACMEAYPQSNEQYACNLGCQSQMPFAEKKQKELSDMMPRIHLLFPLTLVRAFWSDMVDSAQDFVTSSWTFYVQADSGQIVVIQSPPEVQHIPQLQPGSPPLTDIMMDKSPSDLTPDGEGPWSHRAGFLELESNDGLMKCFSLNSNWLLTASLILSVLVLLWICCATVATAADQYIPNEKLSIYGDLEYINEHKLCKYSPASIVVLRGKPEENEEAGPLPAKVDLSHSSI
ncbi:transmembrane protein 59 [Spea bombifrons]|uniref:transmembrane protein 59 n=1 Tax=Spea bombifrons TaxID=233779 RepID=UPI00234B8C8B|nr:transmembrane protein 59 [Spea bombifrons]